MVLGNVVYYFECKQALADSYCYGRYGDRGILVGSDYGIEQCYNIFAEPGPDYQIIKWNWIERKWEELPYRFDSTKLPKLEVTPLSSQD